MIESPLIQEIVARSRQEGKQEAVLELLQARFGSVPPDIVLHLRGIMDEQKLRDINIRAALCPDLEAFRASLSSCAKL
jgi:hypothetical protein